MLLVGHHEGYLASEISCCISLQTFPEKDFGGASLTHDKNRNSGYVK